MDQQGCHHQREDRLLLFSSHIAMQRPCIEFSRLIKLELKKNIDLHL
jgi:hypothetical protein